MTYSTRYGLRTEIIHIARNVNPTEPKTRVESDGLLFESEWLNKPRVIDRRKRAIRATVDSPHYGEIDGYATTLTCRCLLQVTVSGPHQSHLASAICTWTETTTETGLLDGNPTSEWEWSWPRDTQGNAYRAGFGRLVYPNLGVIDSKLLIKLFTPITEDLEDENLLHG